MRLLIYSVHSVWFRFAIFAIYKNAVLFSYCTGAVKFLVSIIKAPKTALFLIISLVVDSSLPAVSLHFLPVLTLMLLVANLAHTK